MICSAFNKSLSIVVCASPARVTSKPSVAAGGVNAVLGHTSGHYQMRNAGLAQQRLQRRIVERTARSLLDDRFAIDRRNALMDRPAGGMGLQRMSFPAVVPEVDHRNARG